jgi:signal transduction histidine kinase/CheY-like chemotaxis protein
MKFALDFVTQSVLVVDDTPANVDVLVIALEDAGHRVNIARSGEETFERIAQTRPDLILLDVMMPGLNGFEVCERLKADAKTADIPVIFMTASAERSDQYRAFEVGGVDYITKPFQIAEVLARAGVHLALRRTQRELAARSEQMLFQIVEGSSTPTFVIDREHRVTHWNRALEVISGVSANKMVGTNRHWSAFFAEERPCMADFLVDGTMDQNLERYYSETGRRSALLEGAYEGTGFFPQLGERGAWLYFTAAPLLDTDGRLMGAIQTLQDISEQKAAEQELKRYKTELEDRVASRTQELLRANEELKSSNRKLEQVHVQLLQSEKMASIGQLAAGVAHEINNPIGFVNSNLGSLESYVRDLLRLLAVYEQHESSFAEGSAARAEISAAKQAVEIDYLRQDLPALLNESKEGLQRVKKIVQDLKDFSHAGKGEWESADLHAGLESTLNIVNNELKYKAAVAKHYGTLPAIECLPLELNQVFMNLLVNAGQALPDKGEITIRTGAEGEHVWVEIADTGTGIAPENLKRIFDPFFSTKPVGKGTGLGLAISYGIVQKHHGRIDVTSVVGQGTTFRVTLPVRQPAATSESEAMGTGAAARV